jgi:hypothetical protein
MMFQADEWQSGGTSPGACGMDDDFPPTHFLRGAGMSTARILGSWCRVLIAAAAVAMTLAAIAPASADSKTSSTGPAGIEQVATAPADADPWRFNATAYAWLLGIAGSTTVRGQTIDTNASFLDLAHKSTTLFGLMGYFEANKGRAGMYADLVYTKINVSASQAAYRTPLPGLRISTSASAALSYELFIAEVGGVYQIARWTGADSMQTSIDGLLAFRYWNNSLAATFDADATFDIGRLFPFERSFGLAVARSDVIQWVDPLIGLRLKHQFTPRHEIMVRGDIGGFGLGSQFSWQAVAKYGYAWQLDGGQKLTALLGFRALAVNYSRGSGNTYLNINEVLYGPIVGLSYRF